MLLICAHRINHGTYDRHICEQIQRSSALVIGPNTVYGAGVYAYYPDRIPRNFRRDPFVVFQALPMAALSEVADVFIYGGPYASDVRFFVLRGTRTTGNAIRVAILGFVNCQGFPPYPGDLYYM